MEITEVRIKLTSGKNEKLRAFCSITIDNDFVIRDLKVIEGAKGAFVAMPSRKLMARCPSCGGKNHYRAPFCNECGGRLSPEKLPLNGRRKLHADVAHPINSGCREAIQQHVLAHYEAEKERAKDPDYRPVDFDDYDDFLDEEQELVDEPLSAAPPTPVGASEDAGEASTRRFETEEEFPADAVADSEWEDDARSGIAPQRGRLPDESGAAVFSSADRSTGASARDRADYERPSGGSTAGGSSPRSSSGDPGDGRREHGGRRGGSRSRQRSGGRRRRGRDSRREPEAPGGRNRLTETGDRAAGGDSASGERSLDRSFSESERSRLAVDFDDLRPRRGGAGGPRGVSRFRGSGGGSRGPDADPTNLRDAESTRDDRARDKRHDDEIDVEPEDNFGAGLFS